jgi:hypothetical protein
LVPNAAVHLRRTERPRERGSPQVERLVMRPVFAPSLESGAPAAVSRTR